MECLNPKGYRSLQHWHEQRSIIYDVISMKWEVNGVYRSEVLHGVNRRIITLNPEPSYSVCVDIWVAVFPVAKLRSYGTLQ